MSDLLAKVARYYSAKLSDFGPSPRGVDWNGEDGQILRFEQLVKLLPEGEKFTVCDIGCGYGAFLPFLKQQRPLAEYLGVDVSPDMVASASVLHGSGCFHVGSEAPEEVDYIVASGIFNVRMDLPAEDWADYIERTLESFHAGTRRGFAFNCLTSYSDSDRMRPDLYYVDPLAIFDFCKRRFSPRVALLHDYPLYEFTLLVRK
jgi:Trans-aconitate methyltransferase